MDELMIVIDKSKTVSISTFSDCIVAVCWDQQQAQDIANESDDYAIFIEKGSQE